MNNHELAFMAREFDRGDYKKVWILIKAVIGITGGWERGVSWEHESALQETRFTNVSSTLLILLCKGYTTLTTKILLEIQSERENQCLFFEKARKVITETKHHWTFSTGLKEEFSLNSGAGEKFKGYTEWHKLTWRREETKFKKMS